MMRSASSTASSILWVTRKMALRGDGLLLPQLQQFAAQVLRRQHVQRGEWLVHEQDLRLDHQRARKADPLPHPAGEFLGIGGLKAVQTDGVEDLQAALAALSAGSIPRAFSGASTFSSTVSQGNSAKLWKTMETLTSAVAIGCVVPVDLARRGRRKPGQHAQQRRFSGARRAQQRDDFARHDGQVGGRDDLDAVLARLRVVLFNSFGTDDRLSA